MTHSAWWEGTCQEVVGSTAGQNKEAATQKAHLKAEPVDAAQLDRAAVHADELSACRCDEGGGIGNMGDPGLASAGLHVLVRGAQHNSDQDPSCALLMAMFWRMTGGVANWKPKEETDSVCDACTTVAHPPLRTTPLQDTSALFAAELCQRASSPDITLICWTSTQTSKQIRRALHVLECTETTE